MAAHAPWGILVLSDVRDLAHRFAAFVHKQGTGTLDDWLAAIAGTSLETPWLTSPVEGRINRLKTIKRMMYGRCGFGLLRRRTLHAA